MSQVTSPHLSLLHISCRIVTRPPIKGHFLPLSIALALSLSLCLLSPFFSRFCLPSLRAVAAGAGRWGVRITAAQCPGSRGGLQTLHVPPEETQERGWRLVPGCLKTIAAITSFSSSLHLQDLHQEVDVAHGQAQNLVLAKLLLRRVGGDQLAQLGEGAVDVVLPPALPRVGEHLTGHVVLVVQYTHSDSDSGRITWRFITETIGY